MNPSSNASRAGGLNEINRPGRNEAAANAERNAPMTTNHPTPTVPPAEPVPSLRPVEKIRADLKCLSNALSDLHGMCSEQGEADARVMIRLTREQLAGDVPSLLARLRAAEETLAAVRVYAEAARAALPDFPYTGVGWKAVLEMLDDHAALAAEASR